MLLFNKPLAALVLLSLQPAAPQLCSQVVGDDPPKSHPSVTLASRRRLRTPHCPRHSLATASW
jgi:hypothetical protein